MTRIAARAALDAMDHDDDFVSGKPALTRGYLDHKQAELSARAGRRVTIVWVEACHEFCIFAGEQWLGYLDWSDAYDSQ